MVTRKVEEVFTDVMTLCPSFSATKSLTFDGGAFRRAFPPMKWEGILCRAAYIDPDLE